MVAVWVLLFLAAQDRQPVPDAAALREAEKMVKDVFKEDYAKGDKRSLARKLLQQGRDTTDDLAAKFVLLREARDVGAQVGDAETALHAIDALAEVFAIEAAAMKNAVLAASSKSAKTPDDYRFLAQAYANVLEEAIARDEYAAAEKSAKSALDFARKAKDVSLTTQLETRSKEVSDLAGRFEKVKKAREKLVQTPDDPAANFVVGFFLCAVKGDWAGGLPMIVKGDDVALKAIAERDLADPGSAADRASVGDSWWDRAEKETGVVRRGLRARAGSWYEKSARDLTGLAKAKVDKRLAELRKEKYKDGWESFPDPVTVKADPGKANQQTFGPLPPGEIDGVSARISIEEKRNIRALFVFNSNSWCVTINHNEGVVSLSKTDPVTKQWTSVKQVPTPNREEYLLTVRLMNGEIVAWVDGMERIREKCPFSKIESLNFQADYGTVVFKERRLHHK